jgi:hypothetical protein
MFYFILLFFFVWHVLVVTCASVIIFYNVHCLFFHSFQGAPSSFFGSSLFHSSSFVASHCQPFLFLGCKQNKVNNLITLSKLEQVDLKYQ